MRYRVAVVPPGGQHYDPLAQSVSIIVIDRDAHTMLSPDGTWVALTEGAAMDRPTVALPIEAMEAFVEAVDAYRGQPSHAKTEAAVLREWLAVERGRVDRMVDLAAPPVYSMPVQQRGITDPEGDIVRTRKESGR